MFKRRKQALIVDEEIKWSQKLEKQLKAEGVSVELSNKLDDGLVQVCTENYNVVYINDRVLDCSERKGIISTLLKKGAKQQDIIFVSDTPQWKKARESFLLGATDHIVK